MAEFVFMPRLGTDMQEGTIVKWLKNVGDHVRKEEAILEITTDKATMEVECPADGVLLKIYKREDETVPIGEKLAVIGRTADEAVPEDAPKAEEKSPEPEKPAAAASPASSLPAAPEKTLLRVSPRARKTAEENQIDVRSVAGTGPGGRIVEKDVLQAIQKRRAEDAAKKETSAVCSLAGDAAVPFAGIRKVIADRMTESLHTMAQANHRVDVDMGTLIELRGQLNAFYADKGIKVSFVDLFIKCAAHALKDMPCINSSLSGKDILLHKHVNVGVAVATERGLLVPVVKNAEQKTLAEIAEARAALVKKAQSGTLAREEMSGGTFTISNLGMYDIDSFTPIVNPPEAGILGIGRTRDCAVVRNREIVIRPMATFSFSYDHRLIDGAPAAVFLSKIKALAENPMLML